MVRAGPPARMVLGPVPATVELGSAFGLRVSIADAHDNFLTDADGIQVTVSLGQNPSGATLGGQTTVLSTNGLADFMDLTIDRSGRFDRLSADSPGFWALMSDAFDVVFTPRRVAAGGSHSCLSHPTGRIYCWGDDASGQLGTGTTGGGGPTPQSNTSDVDLSLMSAGRNHTCAVTIFGAYCWGDNTSGQVGNGGVGGMLATPTRIVDPDS